jgi:hypothetical protein
MEYDGMPAGNSLPGGVNIRMLAVRDSTSASNTIAAERKRITQCDK